MFQMVPESAPFTEHLFTAGIDKSDAFELLKIRKIRK